MPDALARVADAPERWESPVDPELARRHARALAEHAYVPLRWEEVPAGAAPALQEACGAWRLDQLFVIPAGARMVAGRDAHWVATPTQVLGLADRGVALWVDTTPATGVQRVVGLDELAAIDQTQILVSARLRFLAPTRRLAVHYNALARHELDRALAAVRAAACGYPLTVPDEARVAMPSAWAHVANSLAVRLHPDDPALARFAAPPDQSKGPGAALVALTPYELVIVRDPDPDALGTAPASGHDLLHVVRRRLEGVDRTETGARLHAGGVDLEVPLAPSLSDDLLAVIERAGSHRKATDDHRKWRATDSAAG
jgi:hypothetical protein